jgi:hypothetical protein
VLAISLSAMLQGSPDYSVNERILATNQIATDQAKGETAFKLKAF